MNFKSILIVTYARSGSTLLQGILNSIDGVLVRGENKNFIQGLYDAYLRLEYAYYSRRKLHSLHKKQFLSPEHPWYGADVINLQVFLEQCESMIKNILLAEYKEDRNITCYGFKEIRYYELAESGIKLKDYLDFLQQVFPKPAIIFNTRNIDAVIKSSIWEKRNKFRSIAGLMKLEQDFKSYSKTYPVNTFSLTYEDVISKSHNLKLLFDFLGCEYSAESIEDILSKPHSYGQKSINIIDGKVVRYSE